METNEFGGQQGAGTQGASVGNELGAILDRITVESVRNAGEDGKNAADKNNEGAKSQNAEQNQEANKPAAKPTREELELKSLINKETYDKIKDLPIEVKNAIIKDIANSKKISANSERQLRERYRHYASLDNSFADLFKDVPIEQRASVIERAIRNDLNIEKNPAKYIGKIATLYGIKETDVLKALKDYKGKKETYDKEDEYEAKISEVQKQQAELTQREVEQRFAAITRKIGEFKTEVDDKGEIVNKYYDDVEETMGQIAKEYNIADLKTLYNYAILVTPEVKDKIYKEKETEVDDKGNLAFPLFREAIPHMEQLIENGASPDIKELYDYCVWNIPTLREKQMQIKLNEKSVEKNINNLPPKPNSVNADFHAGRGKDFGGDLGAILDDICKEVAKEYIR